MDRGFPRRLRIRKTREYREHRARSRSFRLRDFLVAWAPARQPHCRLGLTVSRKVGGAVVRNRVKRLLREWFRLHHHELTADWDLVIIARRPPPGLGLKEVEEQLGQFVAWINRRTARAERAATEEAGEGRREDER